MARVLEMRRRSVEEMKSRFNRSKLTREGQLSYDLWIEQYELAAAAHEFRRNEYVINQMFSPHTMLPRFLIAVHEVDEPSDMAAYVKRIEEISRALSQSLERAKLNASAGSRPPRFAYDGALQQSRPLVSGAPFEGAGDNAVWTDAQAKVDAAGAARYKTAARKALVESWRPAYRELIAWLEADRPNAAVVATGVGKDPNGRAYYAERLASSTTTDLSPEEIHQIGLSEVARIKGGMEAIKQEVGYEGSLQDFFKYVRQDDRFYYPSTDDGRRAYIEAATAHLAFMKTRLPQCFGILRNAE